MTTLDDVTDLAAVARLAASLPVPDRSAQDAAWQRQGDLTKPPRSLGRLEHLAAFMAGWSGREQPSLERAQALVFAGNHGVCAQGVNPFPQEVTAQMVTNFERGGAAINQLARLAGASLSVVALDLDRPTDDFTTGPALSEAETLKALRTGAQAVDPEAQILTLGEMGIGNSTVAAALAYLVFGGAAKDWVGRGTGSDDAGLARKIEAVEAGRARHRDAKGLDILSAIGGREQAAICGAVIEARMRRIPVILDGFICTAAVSPLFACDPRFLDHCLAGHVGREPGHALLLEKMDMVAVLALDLALGEGTGAALALLILRGALACHNGMATFAEAGVSGR